MGSNPKRFRCACAFAKKLNERDPCQFPRIGMMDNVLYKGHWIIKHKPTGEEAVIIRQGAGPLHAEADDCCFDYFDATQPYPEPDQGPADSPPMPKGEG